MGAVWQSEEGKNLTFSILKRFDAFRADQQFLLNICVSLSIFDVLTTLAVPDVKVKWPNDIMSGSAKICGILIENILKGRLIDHSIIGIGLNVNQSQFENLAKASSISSITGKVYNLDEILHMIIGRIKFYTENVETKTVKQLLPVYGDILFRKDKPSTFEDEDGNRFMGFIRKVSPSGKLVLELEEQIFKEFDLKEVTLLY
ncbi:biotin--[acetyl-CoA-carboxylase] ligase [Muricauda sp. NBRC 101325]|nr:biotin--[acetyl-CoA-carboxylase] ligase [Muricauda sp. NBRC 101325]